MKRPTISLIAAIDERRGLGKNNQLLFKIPEDLRRFRKITEGHPVIMGRKTYESIGKPLPDRTNIVITRDENLKAEGVVIVHSLDEALTYANKYVAASPWDANPEIFIIGGGEIFKQAIDKGDKLYLTIVKGAYDADVFFPEYSEFKKIKSQERKQSGGFSYAFINLTR